MASKMRSGANQVRKAAWLGGVDVESLVQAARSGSARELDSLLSEIRPPLLGYFSRKVDAECADDLAQGVLWIVAREFRAVAPDGAAAWLITVARNLLRDEFRRRSWVAARFVGPDAAKTVIIAERLSTDAEERELRQVVTGAARDACGPAVRDVVARLLDGLTVRDIADASGLSVQAVRMRVVRARAVLGPMLRPLLDSYRFRDVTGSAVRAVAESARPRRGQSSG
jgi:RNA polymerase sigma factor (sigma-70 family)